MTATDRRTSLETAARLVPDGARIGFGGSWGLARRPVSFVRELIRQGRTGLHVHGILSGIDADLLIGAGAAASTTSSYVGFDELGQAPNFQRAAGLGEIEVHEYGEWLITAGYRATNMALPYLPWITSRHSDIVRELGLKEVECPYTGTPLLAVRAIELDVAVIQAVRCDAAGNTELAVPLDHMYDVDALLARSAEVVIVCAEEIAAVDPNRVQLLGREVDAVVEAPRGAWPGSMNTLYGVDRAHMMDTYLPAATAGDFGAYLRAHVLAGDPVAT
jgi:glutaconate CoA-transferase subunit A